MHNNWPTKYKLTVIQCYTVLKNIFEAKQFNMEEQLTTVFFLIICISYLT